LFQSLNCCHSEFIKETFREYNHCEKFLLSFFETFETPAKLKPVKEIVELIRSYKEFSLGRFKKDAERLLQNWYMKVIPTPAFVSNGIIPAVQVGQEINVDTIQNQIPRTPERKEKARLMDERSPVKRNKGYNHSDICEETQQSQSGCDLVVENTEQNSENESKIDDKETISSQENARPNQLSEESLSNQVMSESRDQDIEMEGGSDGARDNGCDLVANHAEQNSENESLVDDKENILSQENARQNHLSEFTISNQTLSESRDQGVAMEGGNYGEDEHQPESDYDSMENSAEKNYQAESKDDDKENVSSSQEKTHVSEDTIAFQSISERSDQGVEMEEESHGEDRQQREGGCELVTEHTEHNSVNESKDDDKEYITNQAIPERRDQDVEMEGGSRFEDEHQQESGGIDQNIDNDLRSKISTKSKRKGTHEKRRALSSRYDSESGEGSTNTSQESPRRGINRKRRAKSTGNGVKILPRRKRVKTNFYKPEIEEPRPQPKGNYKETLSSQESSQSIGNDTSFNESSSASMIRVDRVVHRNIEKDAEIPQNLRGKVCLSVEQEPLTMETFPAEEGDTANAPHSSSSSSTRPNQIAKRNPPSAHESRDQNDEDDSLSRSGGPMLSDVPSRAIVPAPSREVVRREPRKKRSWSEEEKDAIRKGVKKWGLGKWVKIKKAYADIFVGRTNVNIKVRCLDIMSYSSHLVHLLKFG
jgi:hypothetical protein